MYVRHPVSHGFLAFFCSQPATNDCHMISRMHKLEDVRGRTDGQMAKSHRHHQCRGRSCSPQKPVTRALHVTFWKYHSWQNNHHTKAECKAHASYKLKWYLDAQPWELGWLVKVPFMCTYVHVHCKYIHVHDTSYMCIYTYLQCIDIHGNLYLTPHELHTTGTLHYTAQVSISVLWSMCT